MTSALELGNFFQVCSRRPGEIKAVRLATRRSFKLLVPRGPPENLKCERSAAYPASSPGRGPGPGPLTDSEVTARRDSGPGPGPGPGPRPSLSHAAGRSLSLRPGWRHTRPRPVSSRGPGPGPKPTGRVHHSDPGRQGARAPGPDPAGPALRLHCQWYWHADQPQAHSSVIPSRRQCAGGGGAGRPSWPVTVRLGPSHAAQSPGLPSPSGRAESVSG
jgi:hypothetical protein